MTNKTNKYEVTPTDRTADSCLTCSRMSINYSKNVAKSGKLFFYKRSTFRAETALQNDTCFVVLKVSDASKRGRSLSARHGPIDTPHSGRQGGGDGPYRLRDRAPFSRFRENMADKYINRWSNLWKFNSRVQNNPLVPDDTQPRYGLANINTVQFPVARQ